MRIGNPIRIITNVPTPTPVKLPEKKEKPIEVPNWPQREAVPVTNKPQEEKRKQ